MRLFFLFFYYSELSKNSSAQYKSKQKAFKNKIKFIKIAQKKLFSFILSSVFICNIFDFYVCLYFIFYLSIDLYNALLSLLSYEKCLQMFFKEKN